MFVNSFRSAACRAYRAMPHLFRIAAFALFAVFALHAAAGDRAVKSRVAPLYPDIARHLKIEGTVVVEAVVDPAGKVTGVKAVTGSKVLSFAAEEAVRKWTFVPAPEQSTENVEIKFALKE